MLPVLHTLVACNLWWGEKRVLNPGCTQGNLSIELIWYNHFIMNLNFCILLGEKCGAYIFKYSLSHLIGKAANKDKCNVFFAFLGIFHWHVCALQADIFNGILLQLNLAASMGFLSEKILKKSQKLFCSWKILYLHCCFINTQNSSLSWL